jgi:hypothetical protein
VVRVEVDTGGVLLAGSHLHARGSLVAAAAHGCAELPAGLSDPVVRAAATELADVAADVLELVAQDLELLADRVRAGAVLYDDVERRAREAMDRP